MSTINDFNHPKLIRLPLTSATTRKRYAYNKRVEPLKTDTSTINDYNHPKLIRLSITSATTHNR